MNKKEIPLSILQALDSSINKNLDLVIPSSEDGYHFKLIDKEVGSDFYFKVKTSSKHRSSDGRPVFETEFKPKNMENLGVGTLWPNSDGVIKVLNNWLEMVKNYNDTISIYDDPLLKSYQESFEVEFEIVDENADKVPFNLSQQLLLDQYLESFKSKLVELRGNKFLDEVDAVKEIEADISETQRNLTKESKRKVIKRISRFCAKAQKVGLELIKEMAIQAFIEFFKQKMIG